MIKHIGFALPLFTAASLAAAPTLATPGMAQDARPPMTAQDLVTMPRVGSVAATRDGEAGAE